MLVREATSEDREQWNAFVDASGGSFFHYFEWSSVFQAKTWHYIPLLVENNASEIICVFPLVKINSHFYSRLISLPEGASGSFIFQKGLPDAQKSQAIRMVLDYIKKMYSKGCSTLLVKENLTIKDLSISKPTEVLVQNGFRFISDPTIQLPCTHILQLTPSFENDIWMNQWSSDLRNHIRKALKKGVSVREDTDLNYRDECIQMFSSTLTRFGEPLLSKEEIIQRFTGFHQKTRVWVAFLKGDPIGFIICYYTPSSCYWSKIGYDESARTNYANTLLLYEAIRNACAQGYQFFEFGVTSTASLSVWKEQFTPLKVPMRIYEKRYSLLRYLFEKGPSLMKWAVQHPRYIWGDKSRLVRKVMRGEI